MMFPYAEFLLAFDRKHRAFTHHNAPENSRAAVIVETRPDFFFPMVVRNTMFFLGPRWNLHVICGELSHAYALNSFRDWRVKLTKLPGVGRISTVDYSGILLSPSFWERLAEDTVLVFQTDSLLCGKNVDEFTGFDFVGAPCGRFDEQYIANGGLSLRSKKVMLECTRSFRCEPGTPEDVFFTHAVRQIGGSMPDMATATRFAVESRYTSHPFGVHGTDKYFHSVETAQEITRAIEY